MLRISGLSVRFGGDVVVDVVELQVGRGEAVGLTGRSGSGKTMTALAALGLLPAGADARGEVELCGRPMLGCGVRALRRSWGKDIAYVGQEALTALNPLVPVGRQLCIPLRRHRGLSGSALATAAADAVAQVGLPARVLSAFPAQLSGGQRQRIAIAMATACRPALLIADEPTSSLDAITQAGVLDLLSGLPEHGVALLLISHDLAAVAQVCTRLLVLHKGKVVDPEDRTLKEETCGETCDDSSSPRPGDHGRMLRRDHRRAGRTG